MRRGQMAGAVHVSVLGTGRVRCSSDNFRNGDDDDKKKDKHV
jgi:hypothetical protein